MWLTYSSGSQFTRSTVGICICVIFLSKPVASHVNNTFCTRNIPQFPFSPPSAAQCRRRCVKRKPKDINLTSCTDIADVVGKDIGLMIRAFAAALEDENLLVRRAALDILSQSMRINSHAIRKAHHDDRSILMRAATGVVLRRDLSLNRRLYTWLLGSDEKAENQIAYLKDNALELLSSTLKVWLMNSTCEIKLTSSSRMK